MELLGAGFGPRVRRAIDEVGLTQEAVAVRVGITPNWLSRLISGRSQPNLETALALHAAIAKSRPELNLVWLLTGEGAMVNPAVDRRGFLHRAAAVAPILALPTMAVDIERLAAPTRLDPALLELWEGQTEALAKRRPLESPRTLLPAADLHLRILLEALDRSGGDQLRRRLVSLAAGTAAIAAWVSLMAEKRREMQGYLDLGEGFAREVGDTDTLILLLMLRADRLSGVLTGGLEGYPAQAQRALEEAMSLASPETPLTLHAPAILRASEEAAYVGDEIGTRRLLERGAEVIEVARVRDHPLRRHWVTWGWASYAGSAYNLLGATREAIETLTPIDSPFPGHRPLLAADLASAHAQEGNLDEAGRLLGEALGQATEHGVIEGARRVAGVRRRRLARWEGDPIVRALDEQLATVL